MPPCQGRGRKVLDIGCGKGRFARVFQEQEPGAELWGLDISTEMLRFVPPGIRAVAASMTEMPFAGDSFDGAYATESLEHAVEIEKAVAEICRVVKPGGRIAIIDFRMDWPEGPPRSVRLTPEQVKAELGAAGYEFVDEHDFLPKQYFLVFKVVEP